MQTITTPLEVYLHSDYEPDAEYIDGAIEERPMGEHDHAAWQMAIAYWFRQHEEEWRVEVLPGLRVQISPSRFRVPDVAVLDLEMPTQPVATHPPIAIFEVLSPEDRVIRLMRKLNDYAGMGVREIWVIDPETGIFTRFEDGQLLRRTRFLLEDRGIDFEMLRIGKLVRKPR